MGCTHRYLSAATGSVVLRKTRGRGSRGPGCWRRAFSGSNGSKRGINRPTVNRLLELLIFGRWVGFARGPVKELRANLNSCSGQGIGASRCTGPKQAQSSRFLFLSTAVWYPYLSGDVQFAR